MSRIIIIFLVFLACAGCYRVPPPDPGVSDQDVSESRLDINKATNKDLESLPGIGPGLAKKIITHRERYGRFKRTAHLLLVDGISEKRFREVEIHIRVD